MNLSVKLKTPDGESTLRDEKWILHQENGLWRVEPSAEFLEGITGAGSDQ